MEGEHFKRFGNGNDFHLTYVELSKHCTVPGAEKDAAHCIQEKAGRFLSFLKNDLGTRLKAIDYVVDEVNSLTDMYLNVLNVFLFLIFLFLTCVTIIRNL